MSVLEKYYFLLKTVNLIGKSAWWHMLITTTPVLGKLKQEELQD